MVPVIINPNFYQIPLPQVNVFIIKSPGGLILIDTGPAGSKIPIFNAIKSIGLHPVDIKHIIVTHAHHHHSGSLADIVSEVNATVYMHPVDAALVKQGIAYRFKSKTLGKIIDVLTLGSLIKFPRLNIKPVQQIVAVKDGDWIPDSTGLRVIYAPGHSRGQIALYYPNHKGIVMAADVAENIERLKLTPVYHDLHKCLSTISNLARMDFNIALFSHGEPILNDASKIFKEAFGFD